MKCPTCNKDIKTIIESNNPFAYKVVCDNCPTYYVENGFLARFNNYVEVHKEKEKALQDAMLEIVNENKIVVFVADFEAPATNIDGAVYLEFEDVLNHAHIIVQDINQFFYTD